MRENKQFQDWYILFVIANLLFIDSRLMIFEIFFERCSILFSFFFCILKKKKNLINFNRLSSNCNCEKIFWIEKTLSRFFFVNSRENKCRRSILFDVAIMNVNNCEIICDSKISYRLNVTRFQRFHRRFCFHDISLRRFFVLILYLFYFSCCYRFVFESRENS